LIALGSYRFCKSKKDWFWLIIALGFTVVADFFLILHDWHLPGVAVFCFAHLAYIVRAISSATDYNISNQDVKLSATPRFHFWRYTVILIGLTAILASFFLEVIFVVSGLYAILFIGNICLSARYLGYNRRLTITGLLLFLACDICVLIYNLPGYFGAPQWLLGVFPLIWVFYLPSQILIAISAINFTNWKSS